jgi:hypothetical protein
MEKSSYEKVYELLSNCPDGHALRARVLERIENFKIDKIEYILERPKELGQPAKVMVKFHTIAGILTYSFQPSSPPRIYIDIYPFLLPNEVETLVNENFGVKGRVSTYNCNKDVILNKKDRNGTIPFVSWLRRNLSQEFYPILKNAENRVSEEFSKLLTDQSTIEGANSFLTECAINDIKIALSSYKHLGDDTLKRAIQEFICDELFEFQSCE